MLDCIILDSKVFHIFLIFVDLDSPKLIPSQNGKIYEGDILKLTCLYNTSSDEDKVAISWFKDSVKMNVQTTNILDIAIVARNDSGVYTCSVDNGFSVKSASYHLRVYCEFFLLIFVEFIFTEIFFENFFE